MEHQKKLQTLYSGGTVFNIFLGGGYPTRWSVTFGEEDPREKLGSPASPSAPASLSPDVDAERYERLGFTYRAVSELGAGEKEEVRLRRPYAVVSGW